MDNYLVQKHYPHLDGLRGIAIILVLLIHLYRVTFGWVGVDLFFVLSGFLITNILLSYESSSNTYKVFLIRRALRIFPVYFLSLFIIFILGRSLFVEYIPDFQSLSNNQLYFWTYTQNFLLASDTEIPNILNHFWSLAIEEQFYLIWPLIILKLKGNTRNIIVAFSILIVTSVLLKLYSDNISVNYVLLPFRMDSLILGASVSLILWENVEVQNRILQLIFLAVLTILVTVHMQEGSFHHATLWMSKIGYFGVDLFFATLLLVTLRLSKAGGILRDLLDNRLLIFLGKYSYGIYVVHWPLKHVILKSRVLNDLESEFFTSSIIFALSVFLAFIIYHLFEIRFLNLKHIFVAVKMRS